MRTQVTIRDRVAVVIWPAGEPPTVQSRKLGTWNVIGGRTWTGRDDPRYHIEDLVLVTEPGADIITGVDSTAEMTAIPG